MDELEVLKFDKLLAEKRHNEIVKILTGMLSELIKNKDTPQNIKFDTSSLEKTIRGFSRVNESIPASIKLINEAIISKLESIKEDKRPTEWNFNITRNKQGLINNVNAKSK